MKITLAQISAEVANLRDNRQAIVDVLRAHGDSLVVFPEFALCGYCCQDWLLQPSFIDACQASLHNIMSACPQATFLISLPRRQQHKLYNAVVYVANGQIISEYYKRYLPNYSVFDEQRYFHAGDRVGIMHIHSYSMALVICEDLWQDAIIEELQGQPKLDCLLSVNASPYAQGKQQQRQQRLRQLAQQLQCPVAYVNLVGAQDELVFDGCSLWQPAEQDRPYRQLAMGLAQVATVDLTSGNCTVNDLPQQKTASVTSFARFTQTLNNNYLHTNTTTHNALARDYLALLQGLHAYIHKSGSNGVMLGLSGGIDSAFCLALCVDAFGAEAVNAFALPSQYSSDLSNSLAEQQCQQLGVKLQTLNIQPAVDAVTQLLTQVAGEVPVANISRQNIQARIRANALMAIANESSNLLIATGNKSEYAMGYATLYGDMCGAYAPIKDVYKTKVYQLSHWRNRISAAIPAAVIAREPTAELMPQQKDSDSLPAYERLDAILYGLLEKGLTTSAIIQQGFDVDTVELVAQRLLANEFKRQQAPIGTRISNRAFGRDYRMPISKNYQL